MFNRADVVTAVERVLRHDLKFGQAVISEETQLVQGDLHLDSLDLLMVVTGTEKALGVKLPTKRIDASVMHTVGSFVDFVASELTTTARRA